MSSDEKDLIQFLCELDEQAEDTTAGSVIFDTDFTVDTSVPRDGTTIDPVVFDECLAVEYAKQPHQNESLIQRVRKHVLELLDKKGFETAIRYIEEALEVARGALVSSQPGASTLQSCLNEIDAHVSRRACEKRILPNGYPSLLDRRIDRAGEAVRLAKDAYGIAIHRKTGQLLELMGATIEKKIYIEKSAGTGPGDSATAQALSTRVEEIYDRIQDNYQYFRRRRQLSASDVLQLNRARINYAHHTYKNSKETYLLAVQRQKAILLDVLEDWLGHFLKRRVRLEQDSKPNFPGFNKLRRKNFESMIDKNKTGRYVIKRPEIIKQCREALYRIGQAYVALGHFAAGHTLLTIVDEYGWISDSAQLHFAVQMAKLNHNEDLLKAIDRLEDEKIRDIVNDLSKKEKVDRNVWAYYNLLGSLYYGLGFKHLAYQNYNKAGQGPPYRRSAAEPEPRGVQPTDVSAVSDAEENIIESIENQVGFAASVIQKPSRLIRELTVLVQRLQGNAAPDGAEVQAIIALNDEIRHFLRQWISHSQIYGSMLTEIQERLRENGGCVRSPLELQITILNTIVILCQVYQPAYVPKYLIMLGEALRNSGDLDAAIDALSQAGSKSARLAYWKGFKGVYEMIIKEIEDNAKSVRFSNENLVRLCQTFIALSEGVMARAAISLEDRAEIVQELAPSVNDCAFRLAVQSGVNKKGEWLFRATNLLKGRMLSLLQSELPTKGATDSKDMKCLQAEVRKLNELLAVTNKTPEITKQMDALREGIYAKRLKLEDPFGVGGCSGEGLKRKLDGFTDKKICVLSYTVSQDEDALLITGVSNYERNPWYWMSQDQDVVSLFEISILVNGCWKDVGLSESFSYLESAFDAFIKPIIGHIEKADLLYIVPDAKLYNLPFHALYGKMKSRSQFVIQAFEVAYMHSAHRLLSLTKTLPFEKGTGFALGYGDTEVQWNKHQQVFKSLGIKARDPGAGVIERLESRQYVQQLLYIIGHGHLPGTEESPFDAWIGPNDASFYWQIPITAQMFMQMEDTPKAHLVFLNSCRSGEGMQSGSDIYGFPYALAASRHPSSLVAAVPVDIKFALYFAETVVSKIYEENKDLANSVADTIRSVLSGENSEWKHPYYWAPYFLYGDYRSLPKIQPCSDSVGQTID